MSHAIPSHGGSIARASGGRDRFSPGSLGGYARRPREEITLDEPAAPTSPGAAPPTAGPADPPAGPVWPRRLVLGLLVLAAVRIAAAVAIPLVDTTESRYAQVAADMAETGDWITPRIRVHDHLVPFEGKPPLHFWLGAAVQGLLGRGELAARLPSILAGLLTLYLVRRLGRGIVGDRASAAAVALLAIGPMFLTASGLVMLDPTLTAATTGAILLGLGHDPRAPRGARVRRDAALAACLALGFLTKGPFVLAVVGAAGIAVSIARRSLDPLRGHAWLTGGVVLVAIAAPWFWISELRHPGFLEYFFLQENWYRFTRPEIGDKFGSVHVHFPAVSLVWWAAAAVPTLLVLPFAARRARRDGRPGAWHEPPFGAIFAASLGPAVLLAPSSTIQAAYLLPVAPFVALAGGVAWTRSGLRLERLGTVVLAVAAVAAIAFGIAGRKVAEEKSSRDAVARARTLLVERGGTELVFPRKTPWSAYYYGGDAVVPRMDDRYLLRVLETLEQHPDAVFILKHRERRRLPEDVRARFEWIDRVGIWHLGIRAGTDGSARPGGAGGGTIPGDEREGPAAPGGSPARDPGKDGGDR